MVLGARTRYATRFALFRVQIFRGSPLDHENHENITPRKIPAIRYIYKNLNIHIHMCPVHTLSVLLQPSSYIQVHVPILPPLLWTVD